MHRTQPSRWLAARRAAKRRGGEVAPREPGSPQTEPLPPLVSPDDDREFLEPQPMRAQELKTASGTAL